MPKRYFLPQSFSTSKLHEEYVKDIYQLVILRVLATWWHLKNFDFSGLTQ